MVCVTLQASLSFDWLKQTTLHSQPFFKATTRKKLKIRLDRKPYRPTNFVLPISTPAENVFTEWSHWLSFAARCRFAIMSVRPSGQRSTVGDHSNKFINLRTAELRSFLPMLPLFYSIRRMRNRSQQRKFDLCLAPAATVSSTTSSTHKLALCVKSYSRHSC